MLVTDSNFDQVVLQEDKMKDRESVQSNPQILTNEEGRAVVKINGKSFNIPWTNSKGEFWINSKESYYPEIPTNEEEGGAKENFGCCS